MVALGPWSDLVFRPLGYSIPLNVKRGYHLHLKPRGNAVLIDGELQSHLLKGEDGFSRNIVEIKARRIQFLNKRPPAHDAAPCPAQHQHEEEPSSIEDDSFDKFLTSEEAQLLKDHTQSPSHRP